MRSLLPPLAAVALVLAGCASAMPGYVPPSAKLDKIKAVTPKGGGIDGQGVYQLTEQEQKLDCKGLTGSVVIKIMQVREADARYKPSAAAGAAQQAVRPFKKSTDYGYNLDADKANDRARLEALNRQLAAKQCRTFDLEADLKPGNTETPRPIGEVKPKQKSK